MRYAIQKRSASGPVFLDPEGEWAPAVEYARLFDTPGEASAVAPEGATVEPIMTFKETTRRTAQQHTLPVDTKESRNELWEALGFKFWPPLADDPLFRLATLPAAWKIVQSTHTLWRYILDENGKQRVAIFYKPDSHDRTAFMRFVDPATADDRHPVLADA
jgi:hypothetical protein